MKETINYKFKKIELQDSPPDITIHSDNFDIIDITLKKLENTIGDLDAEGIKLPDGTTISEKIKEITNTIGNKIELETADVTSLVAAINELVNKIKTHTKESPSIKHRAKEIGLDDVKGHFTAEDIEGAMSELFINVSNGKSNLATAVTDKGVPTSSGDTFSKIATNINNIVTDPSIGTTDAVAQDILSPKKAVSGGKVITGTMQNRGSISKSLTTQGGSYTIPSGYHSGAGKVTATFGNLSAGNIRKGVSIGGVTGTVTEGVIKSSHDDLYNEGKTHYVTGSTTRQVFIEWSINYKGTITVNIDSASARGEDSADRGTLYICKNGITQETISLSYNSESDIRCTLEVGAGDLVSIEGKPKYSDVTVACREPSIWGTLEAVTVLQSS